ncbi:MAG: hypothetical protein U0136_19540 [Bdellovibrionota bacterium]
MNQTTGSSTGNGSANEASSSSRDVGAEPLKAPLKELDEKFAQVRAQIIPWYSRAIEFVEENPGSTAAGLAGALGVLFGAGYLGKKMIQPESKSEQLQSKLASVLSGAAEALENGKQNAAAFTETARSRGADLSSSAGDSIETVKGWLRKSASDIANELPEDYRQVGQRGLEALSKVVEQRPSLLSVAAAAAVVACGTFAYSKLGEQPTARGPRSQPGQGTGGRKARSYETSSREDLYEEAKKLRIAGRSSMSREELIEALKRH